MKYIHNQYHINKLLYIDKLFEQLLYVNKLFEQLVYNLIGSTNTLDKVVRHGAAAGKVIHFE